MKLPVFFILFCMASAGIASGRDPLQAFDKAVFYSVMSAGKIATIDSELLVVRAASMKEKDAYEGALLMKKAGLAGRPKEKLALFRSGGIKLESSLAKDSSNTEYHFLRLTIQEHAPRIVKYYKDQLDDCRHIYKSFKNLSPVIQKAILEYSRHSKILREGELNG